MTNIIDFLNNNEVPKDFDDAFYQQQYPETTEYYKSFCEIHNISDRDRLYHHYEFYGKYQNNFANASQLEVLNVDLPQDSIQANVILYTTYFISNNESRQKELDHCFVSNINNPYIREIYVFVNSEAKQRINTHVQNIEKVKYIDCDESPTYKMWLENCSKDWGIHVFANADIVFDESIEQLSAWVGGTRPEIKPRRILCLSRYDVINNEAKLHNNPHWSQDVWAISHEDLDRIDFIESLAIQTGKYRCDNKLAYEFAINGWDLFNPCDCKSLQTIRCFHYHESNVRTYNKKDKSIIGSVCFVHPCKNASPRPSRLEFEIMPLATNNVISCKLSEYLSRDTIDVDDFKKYFNFNTLQSHNTVAAWKGLTWQTPATTEKDAYIDHLISYSEKSMDHAYFGFPWATFIDKCSLYDVQIEDAYELLPNKPEPLDKNKRNHTVIQHIRWKDILPICKKLNITDLHISHCEKTDDHIDSINLHPWKISAANFINGDLTISNNRKYFLSFIGAYADVYRSDIRHKLDTYFKKHQDEKFLYELREQWCYQDIVYLNQIDNQTWTKSQANDLRKKRERYNKILSNSLFSICPEGTGPNTIRLWESMSVGVIPVIFSDKWKPPILKNIEWEDFSVFIPQADYNNTLEILHSIPMQKIYEMQINSINAYKESTNMRCF